MSNDGRPQQVPEHPFRFATKTGVERSLDAIQKLVDLHQVEVVSFSRSVATLKRYQVTADDSSKVGMRLELFIDYMSERLLTEEGRLKFEIVYASILAAQMKEAVTQVRAQAGESPSGLTIPKQ